MLKIIFKFILVPCAFLPINANAWVVSSDATIEKIIQWHDNQQVYFNTSTGNMCYIPSNEDKFYSLLLAMWASGKKGEFHCFDATTTTQGIVGHRLHRIITK